MTVLLERLGLGPTGPLAAPHVPMPPGEAEEVAARWWGRTGAAHRLAAEKDDTFHIRLPDAGGFVLKVAGPSERKDHLEFEVALMEHIRSSDCRITVPETLRAWDGSSIVTLTDHAGQYRLARLITFIRGQPLDQTGTTASERARVGEALARLRSASAGFSHPAEGRVCAWDVANLPALAPLLMWVRDRHQRALLEDALEQFNEVVPPRMETLRTQVLHNDFSRSNVIVDHEDPAFVTGVIDFGDAVCTAIAIDVSTALLNQLPRTVAEVIDDDLFAQGRDLLRGYLRLADLTDDELGLLAHLVRGRVIARALITLYRAARLSGNATYILRNTEQGWMQLRWFAQRSVEELSEAFL